ncbi:MAG TPA: dTDP-glucose 4,6-dehydratase [Candidatus Polarisedimenticolaceae bacterium]
MARRLLVTGGAGFIGTNFVRYWRSSHPDDRIVVLDALTYAGNPENLPLDDDPDRFRFVHGDVTDAALVGSLFEAEAFDRVVHFAAESHVDRSLSGSAAFIRTNVLGTHVLLEAARRATSLDRFHHVSTDEVYGSLGPDDPPFHEGTPYAPNSPYAASKAASDHLVRAYHHTYGLPTTISNCSNNYGPYQYPEKLIPLAIVRAISGESIPIYGDGRNVRDWLHVEDHVRGIERILERGRVGEVYNLGGSAERANLDLVEMLCRAIDARFAADPALAARFPSAPAARGATTGSAIAFVTDRPGHDRRYAIDARKARAELGFAPTHTLESGIAETVAWYLGHEAWWRRVQDAEYRAWIDRHYGEKR